MSVGGPTRRVRKMFGGTGRSDLIAALAASDLRERDLDAARLLGFSERLEDELLEVEAGELEVAREEVASSTAPKRGGPGAVGAPRREARQRERRPVPLWRVVAAEEYDEPTASVAEAAVRPLAPEELKRRGGPSPAHESLAPWSRLGPRLHRALNVGVGGRSVDIRALVGRVARGELVRDVPRVMRRAWPQRMVVMIDRSSRLIPFWADQVEVFERLVRACGARAVELRLLPEGPDGRVLAVRGGREVDPRRVPVGEPVLALTDLGCYAECDAVSSAWRRVARELKQAGCFPRALVPAPASRWRPAVARSWRAGAWERERERSIAHDELQRRDRAEVLLRLVSPAARVEPGLLRAVRRLLPRDTADAGTEADAWNHPAILGGHASAMGIAERSVREAFRNGFASARSPDELALQEEVAALLTRWHAPLGSGVRAEELLTLHALAERLVSADEVAWAHEYLTRMYSALSMHGDALPEELRASVTGFAGRMVQRVPTGLFAEGELGDTLTRIWLHVLGGARDVELPPGVTPERLARLVGTGPPRSYSLRQEGSELVVTPGSPAWPVARGERGSPLASMTAARRELAIGASTVLWTPTITLSEGAPVRAIIPPEATLELRSDRSVRVLASFVKPTWACAAGRDVFGLWATLEVGDARQRFRWIPPGRYVMGSSAHEQSRYSDEGPQREVSITRGFWLGDTPCTQAMWQALTGDNPSHFQTSRRPVEQVSWDDVNASLDRLNEACARDPDGLFRLPSEAEWEYACRAGTTSSTYAGELEIIGANNAPLLDDIAWYGGNSGVKFDLDNGVDSSGWPEKQYEHTRAGTREVAQKTPNRWGLHDMLGNVWEWCADGWQSDAYSRSRSAADPLVPVDRDDRVIRGGSWSDGARDVRPACRFGYLRGYRGNELGFRLARGQELRPLSQVDLHVTEVHLPTNVLALVGVEERPIELSASVASIIRGDSPGSLAFVRRYRPKALAYLWSDSDGFQIKIEDADPESIRAGMSWKIDKHEVSIQECMDFAESIPNDDRLRIIRRSEIVEIFRGSSSRPLVISGRPANLISLLISFKVPVHWQTLAREIWGDRSMGQLRQLYDVTLRRLRRRLLDGGVRSDLVRRGGRGNCELNLYASDEVVDES